LQICLGRRDQQKNELVLKIDDKGANSARFTLRACTVKAGPHISHKQLHCLGAPGAIPQLHIGRELNLLRSRWSRKNEKESYGQKPSNTILHRTSRAVDSRLLPIELVSPKGI